MFDIKPHKWIIKNLVREQFDKLKEDKAYQYISDYEVYGYACKEVENALSKLINKEINNG